MERDSLCQMIEEELLAAVTYAWPRISKCNSPDEQRNSFAEVT